MTSMKQLKKVVVISSLDSNTQNYFMGNWMGLGRERGSKLSFFLALIGGKRHSILIYSGTERAQVLIASLSLALIQLSHQLNRTLQAVLKSQSNL